MKLSSFEIPGHVSVGKGAGGLPVVRIETEWSQAEVYLHGAHITHFQKKGEEPLLFMSAASSFQAGKAIRGGVPVIFPWFGPREGQAAHGFARLTEWELIGTKVFGSGEVYVEFQLPTEEAQEVVFAVTVGQTLKMELSVTNLGESEFSFENCLHTYFQIGDIREIEVRGLQGTSYIGCFSPKVIQQEEETIRFSGEVDRVYFNSPHATEIVDPVLRRVISIKKSGSLSTVVWNPWIEKARSMADFGDEEYLRMVCVESGNVKQNALTLAPEESSCLSVEIGSASL